MTAQIFIPMLAYADASRAAEWLTGAFGFSERERFADERGVVTDVVLEYRGQNIMVGHPTDAYRGPREHARTCAEARAWLAIPYIVDGVVVDVTDLDAHYARAKTAGALVLSEPETNDLQRQYRVEDLEGHRWMFAQPRQSAV